MLKETTLAEKVSLLSDFFQENDDNSDFLLKGCYRKITLSSANDEVIETTVDGDAGPHSPLCISILPQYMSFLYLDESHNLNP